MECALCAAAPEPIGSGTDIPRDDLKTAAVRGISHHQGGPGAAAGAQHDVVDVVRSGGGPGRTRSLLVNLDVPC